MINQFIIENCLSIPELPRSHFSVEKDRILWSCVTAKCLLDQWSEVITRRLFFKHVISEKPTPGEENSDVAFKL